MNTRMPPRRGTGDEGSALIIALMFVTMFGLLVAGVITLTDVGLKAARALETRARSATSADGAAEATVARLARGFACDDYTAPRVGSTPETATPVNKEGMAVRCKELNATTGGRATKPPSALLSLGVAPEDGIVTGTGTRTLGDLFSNSTVKATGTLVTQGDVSALGDCTGNIQTLPATPLHCPNKAGGADPVRGADPDFTKATASVPIRRSVPACPPGPAWLVTLEPGYYDDAAALSNLTNGGCPSAVVWFQPGIYYLNFTFRGGPGTWTVSDASVNVVGGTPKGWNPEAATRPQLSVPGTCRSGIESGPVDGIQVILGGESHLDVSAGRVELCATPSTNDQQIALYGIHPDRPIHTLKPTDTTTTIVGFTNPERAFTIGESPVATADAALAPGGRESASLTLTGFMPTVPDGSIIDTAVLRVAHAAEGDIGPVTVTAPFLGDTCGPQTLSPGPGPPAEDVVDLRACGLTDPRAFADLAVTYASSLAPGGTSATARLDGIWIDVGYRTPVTRKPVAAVAATGFTQPERALEIGEQPARWAEADLDSGGPTEASLTLAGYGDPPLPPGSVIDSAVLRVAHQDLAGQNPATVSVAFPGSACNGLQLPVRATSVVDDRVDLKACGLTGAGQLTGLTSITYGVGLAPGATNATSRLDGMWLEVAYRTTPSVHAPASASTTAYANPDAARAIDGTTADVTLNSAGTTSASLTLAGYDQPQVPPGSVIDSAVLRIAHRDEGDVNQASISAEFPGNACSAFLLPPFPVVENVIDLQPCGLTDREELAGLSVVYSVELAPGGTAGTSRVDGVVLELSYRPPATYRPSTTNAAGFANPDNAKVIDGSTADGALSPAGPTSASITLGGYDQFPLPPGSAIDSAALRVTHQEDGSLVPSVTAGFTGSTCAAQPLPLQAGGPGDDRVDIRACGFTDPSQLGSLTATYTAALPAAATGLSRSPTGVTTSGFANPDAARVIDGVTADAALSSGGTTSASVTLDGFGQPPLPAGSTLDSAVLQIAHQDDGDLDNATVTVSWASGSCNPMPITPHPGTLGVNGVDLTACGLTNASDLTNLVVTYATTLTSTGAGGVSRLDGVVLDLTHRTPATAHLDGIAVEITFRPPAFEPLTGCLADGPYPSLGCALVKVTPGAVAAPTRFVVDGTIYAPNAPVDVDLDRVKSQVVSRGVVARTIRLNITPDPVYRRPVIGVPPETLLLSTYPLDTRVATSTAGTGFTNPGQAMTIDGATADAGLANAGPTSASLVLTGFDQGTLAGGSTVDAAVLRVAHQDDDNLASVKVTLRLADGTTLPFDSADPSCSLCLHPASAGIVEDRIELSGPSGAPLSRAQLASATVTYEATLAPGAGNTATARLDGIALEIFSRPLLRARVTFDRDKPTVRGWSVLR